MGKRIVTKIDPLIRPLLVREIAVWTGYIRDVTRIFLLMLGERSLAGETNGRTGLAEGGIDADALVEDEAFAIVVIAADFLEVFQDAAFELIDLAEAGPFCVFGRV